MSIIQKTKVQGKILKLLFDGELFYIVYSSKPLEMTSDRKQAEYYYKNFEISLCPQK